MDEKKTKGNLLLLIVTPVIILLICTAVIILGAIKPYNKISMYLNLAFNDSTHSNPINSSNGLVIKDGNINLEYEGSTSEEGEVIRPSFGEQYAVLRSDKLETSVPVYWGSERELLKLGACHASYSKLPGEGGKTVISAHADTFFNNLSELKTGDKVTINTNYGEFTYTVKESISFKKTDKKYVNPSDETKLVLYTCKMDVLGASDERIGVVCELAEKKFYVQAEEGTLN